VRGSGVDGQWFRPRAESHCIGRLLRICPNQ